VQTTSAVQAAIVHGCPCGSITLVSVRIPAIGERRQEDSWAGSVRAAARRLGIGFHDAGDRAGPSCEACESRGASGAPTVLRLCPAEAEDRGRTT
jgi:hypothetical protein